MQYFRRILADCPADCLGKCVMCNLLVGTLKPLIYCATGTSQTTNTLMFESDIQQLRTLLLRVVTAEGNSPDDQARLNAAYDSIVLAIAHLEDVQASPNIQFHPSPVADLYEAITQEERLKELR